MSLVLRFELMRSDADADGQGVLQLLFCFLRCCYRQVIEWGEKKNENYPNILFKTISILFCLFKFMNDTNLLIMFVWMMFVFPKKNTINWIHCFHMAR